MIFVEPGLDRESFFGLVSAALTVSAFLPYIYDILRRSTRPQRASWFIWSVLSSIAFGAQASEGATDTLWFSGSQLAGTVVVFALSLQYGVGGLVNRTDAVFLGLASLGLLIWYLTDIPAYALGLSIAVSALGGMLTISKAYLSPHTETISTWIVLCAASLYAVIAAGAASWTILAYPLYLLTLYGCIVAACIAGRQREQARKPSV